MSKSQATGRGTALRAGLAAGAAVVTALATLSSPAFAEPKLALTPATGPSGGTNTVIAQAPTTGTAPFLASTPPVVEFQAITASVTACSLNYKTPAAVAGSGGNLTAGAVAVSTVYRISATRIAVTVPADVALPANFTTARFNMCVYDTTSTTTSTLLASAPYSVSAKPLITNITPTAGPALGGYTINVSGTGFTSGTTATLGNLPLTNITVNPAGTLLTGTAPAGAAGSGVQLVVTSAGGTVSSNDPNQDGSSSDATNFALTNGLVVTPNTSPNTVNPSLDIMGVGFSAMTFADTDYTTSASANPHIVLVPKNTGYAGALAGNSRPITICKSAIVLADTELLCTLMLTTTLDPDSAATTSIASAVPNGVYNLQIVKSNASAVADNVSLPTAITSGSTFTVAPY